MKQKKSKVKGAVITIVVLLLIAGALTGGYLLATRYTRTAFNENPSANGNTAGNLYNKGYFTEADGKVYFSNPLDHGCLYVMDENETTAKKVSAETVYSLNAYGKYLYYCKNNINDSNSTSVFRGSLVGAARSNLDGSNTVELNNRYTGSICLIGNQVLLQDYDSNHETNTTTCTINALGIDGKDEKIITEQPIDIAGVAGSSIYYTGVTENHNIYKLNPKTKSSSLVCKGNCWMPVVNKQDIYYIDLDNNYSLIKAKLSNPSDRTTLVKERISSYNVSGTYIYFQIDDQDNSKLCRIRKDAQTNEYEVIMEGNFENINITSNYVYFNQFNNRSMTYRTPVNGSIRVQSLSDAITFKAEN